MWNEDGVRDLWVCGLSHQTAPIEVRERFAIPKDHLTERLKDLHFIGVREAVALSTCNRTEVYGIGRPAFEEVFQLMTNQPSVYDQGVLYARTRWGAVRHAIRMGAGLDSLVVGEAQIFGQLKEGVRVAEEAGTVGPALKRLFPRIFSAVKRVRRESDIGAGAVSVTSVAVEVAQKLVSNLSGASVGVIGAGKIGRLAVEAFVNAGVSKVMIASRTLDHVRLLCDAIGPVAQVVEEAQTILESADIIICSLASPTAVIDGPRLKAAMVVRRHRPVFLIDLGVPRNVDPAVAGWNGVFVYNIDDLKEISSKRLESRRRAGAKAERLIEESLIRFQQPVPTESLARCPLRAMGHMTAVIPQMRLTR